MPAVVAFGRRWACGSDDFVFPGVLDTTVKSCWLISALLTFLQRDVDKFEYKEEFLIYLLGMMGFLGVIVLVDVFAVYQSARGSIMDGHLRTMIPLIIYIRLSLEAVDTGWNTLGTYWVFGPTFSNLQNLDPSSFYFIRRYVICNWVSLVILALFFLFLYDPLGGRGDVLAETYRNAQAQFWTKKLLTYSSIFHMRSHTLNEVQSFEKAGKSMASILGDTNFVGSDGFAGLFTLFRLEEDKLRQPLDVLEQRSQVADSFCLNEMKSEELKGSASIAEILQMQKYFPYSTTKWAMALSKLHSHGAARTWFQQTKTWCCFSKTIEHEVEPTGICPICKMNNFFNVLNMCGIAKSDLVYMSIMNTYDDVPLCIFIDHKLKSIVFVVISSGIGPYLTFSPVLLVAPEIPPGLYVHGGLLNVSQILIEKTLCVVENLKKSYENYGITLIGHSFAAGVAVLVGIQLFAKFPTLRVIALNPPGGLLCAKAAKFTETFVTSITFGHDVVARCSLPALQTLRTRVVNTLHSCQTPKYKLLIGILLRFFGYKLNVKMNSSKLIRQCSNGHGNEAMVSDEAKNTDDAASDGNELNFGYKETSLKMYLPGKIILIQNSISHKNPEAHHQLDEIEILDGSFASFSEITLSPKFLKDHYKSETKILNVLKCNEKL